jgi:hypothetical protein
MEFDVFQPIAGAIRLAQCGAIDEQPKQRHIRCLGHSLTRVERIEQKQQKQQNRRQLDGDAQPATVHPLVDAPVFRNDRVGTQSPELRKRQIECIEPSERPIQRVQLRECDEQPLEPRPGHASG